MLNFIFGLIIIFAIWTFISFIAFLFSKALNNKAPIATIFGLSNIGVVINYLYLAYWHLSTSYQLIFKDRQIIFGLIFLFIIGGIAVGISMWISSIFVAIPQIFLERFNNNEEKEKKQEIKELDLPQVPDHFTKNSIQEFIKALILSTQYDKKELLLRADILKKEIKASELNTLGLYDIVSLLYMLSILDLSVDSNDKDKKLWLNLIDAYKIKYSDLQKLY